MSDNEKYLQLKAVVEELTEDRKSLLAMRFKQILSEMPYGVLKNEDIDDFYHILIKHDLIEQACLLIEFQISQAINYMKKEE